MSITFTGWVLISFALLSSVTMPARLMQSIFFFASFSATAVANFSNLGLSPCLLLIAVYSAWRFWSGDLFRPAMVSRDHFCLLLLLTLFLLISVVSLVINQATREVELFGVTQTIYIAFGVFLTFSMSVVLTEAGRLEAAIEGLRAGAVCIAIWGVVQAACHYSGIAYPAEIFNNSTSHSADMFDQTAADGSIVRISSVAVEPSFMAVSLMIFGSFGATLLAVEPRFRTRSWTISVGLVLLIVAFSTSSTAYASMAALVALLGVRRPAMTSAIVVIIALAAALTLAALPDFRAAIYEMTIGKGQSGSYQERSGTVIAAMTMISDRPWFGWGWGGVVSYSLLSQLPTNVGGLGTSCFVLVVVGTLLASRSARAAAAPSDWKLVAYAHGCENALIVFMVGAVVAGFHFVVPDYWLLWALAMAVPSCLKSSCNQQLSGRFSPIPVSIPIRATKVHEHGPL